MKASSSGIYSMMHFYCFPPSLHSTCKKVQSELIFHHRSEIIPNFSLTVSTREIGFRL